ncbi:MAG: diguanylate cyclase, partial [Candidatus Dadabacteria bacterium]|nr:diguanylate cyclase [Candidatus Dadabacteria bacterium]
EVDRNFIDAKLQDWIDKKQGWNNLVIRWQHKNGGYRFLESSSAPIFDEHGELFGYRGVDRDITERKQAEEQLSYQASHDALTGLVNRREFELRAEKLIATAKNNKSKHALCFMDLDQFKIVNDTCG